MKENKFKKGKERKIWEEERENGIKKIYERSELNLRKRERDLKRKRMKDASLKERGKKETKKKIERNVLSREIERN